MSRFLRDNRWMSFEDIIGDAAVEFRDMSAHEIDRGTWLQWASEGVKAFARRSLIVHGQHKVPLVIGQELYRLPDDCIRPSLVILKYPGEDERRPTFKDIEEFKDGVTPEQGNPDEWYLSRDRLYIGLRPVPNIGGFVGYTTANGNAGGTTMIASGLSATDDIYNGRTVRILDAPPFQGQTATVLDYDGATKTLTLTAPGFGAQIVSGVRFEIHPDSLIVDYIQDGNAAHVLPITTYAVQNTITPLYETLTLDLPDRPDDWWKGCEIRFTSGVLLEEKTRIVTSRVPTTGRTTVTVYPELPMKPAIADLVKVTDVPNIPQAFHPAIVHYCLWKAMSRPPGMRGAADEFNLFKEGIEEAISASEPQTDHEYEQMNTEDVEEDMC